MEFSFQKKKNKQKKKKKKKTRCLLFDESILLLGLVFLLFEEKIQ